MTGRELAHKYFEERLPWLYKEVKYEQARLPLAKLYQEIKKQYLYVGLENNKWTSSTQKSVVTQIMWASIELSEAFEACIELAKELGRDTTDFDKRYEAFGMSLMREMDRFFKFGESPEE